MSPLDLEKELEACLKRRFGKSLALLDQSIQYSVLAPGKRIRPRLALATGEALKLHPETSLRAALSLELIHCFTLIHDDLPCMDNDDLRRGQPTNHKKFGEAIALLAGDALIGAAVETFLEATEWTQASYVLEGLKQLAWILGPRGVAGGQALEIEMQKNPSSQNLETLKKMHRAKTGYLFEGAILLPLALSGEPKTSSLISFSETLGQAFQVVDDLQDWEQDQKTRNPANICSYFSDRKTLIEQTKNELINVKKALKQDFKDTIAPLLTISEEIEHHLQ